MGINCCSQETEPPEITINKPENNRNLDVLKQNPNSANNHTNELIIVNPIQTSQIQQSLASSGSSSSIICPHMDQNSPRALNNLVNLNNFYINNGPNDPHLFIQKENIYQNINNTNNQQFQGLNNNMNINIMQMQQHQSQNNTGEERSSAVNRAYAYEIIKQAENNQPQNYVIVDKLFEHNQNKQLRSKFDDLFKQESNEIDNAFFDYLVSLNPNPLSHSQNIEQTQPKAKVKKKIQINNKNQYSQVNQPEITVQSNDQRQKNPLFISQKLPNNKLLLNDNNIV
jgi:hypothetical protein